jgi:AI-2 transport protein TqsA|tara:strand:+ start:211 stop:1203 length:993 start_codon:yes stop_codon:yes gene_type:complete
LERVQVSCVATLTALAVAAALYWLAPVMVPFVLASFIAIVLWPLVDLVSARLRLPTPLAMAVVAVVAVAVVGLLGGLVSRSIIELGQDAGAYRARLTELQTRALELFGRSGLGIDALLPSSATVAGWISSVTNALGGLLSQSVLVLIFALFLLGGRSRTAPATGVWRDIESSVQGYVAAKLFTSALTGVLVGTALWLLGIDLAFLFGLFAFLLNFIPNVGSLVATLLPLPIILVSPDVTGVTAVLALAIPGAVQFGVGNVLEPRLMGSSLDLHPAVILMALIFWGMLWGFVGMLLATPLTAVLKIVLERNELTAPVAELLAGRFRGRAVS